MSDFIENLKALWVGNRQREFHNRTRGIMTPEDRRLLEEEFDRWLEQVKADAWDEGYSHCFDMERRGDDSVSKLDNPYRKEQDGENS